MASTASGGGCSQASISTQLTTPSTTTTSYNRHRESKEWCTSVPFHLVIWLDDRISTILLGVRKPWIGSGDDMPFVIVLKLRKADKHYIWLHGAVQKVDGKRMLQLSVTAETNGGTSSSHVTDRLKAYDMKVGDFFRLLVRYGFDQYQFAEPGDGRHWILTLRKFLLDRNHAVHFDADDTPLEICSPWWNEVEDGLFKGSPEVGPFWSSKEGKERFEAVKRRLAEAGL